MINLVRYLFYHDCLLVHFLLEILVLKLEVFGDHLDLVQVFVLTFNMISLGPDEFLILHAHVVLNFFVGQVRLAVLDGGEFLGRRIVLCGYHSSLRALCLVNQVLHIGRPFLDQLEHGLC